MLLLAWTFFLGGSEPEWGSFRGSGGAGLAAPGAYPEALDPAANLRWRTPVPAGFSSPVVAGERVFLTGARETVDGKTTKGELVTLCLDAATGAIRWQQAVPFEGAVPGRGSSAAPSPATDGTRVVALFHHFGLLAYDLDGKELWRQPLGPFRLPHGMSSSPLVADGLVVVQVDQDAGAHVSAYDAATGELRWRVERPEFSFAYSSPALFRPAEGPPQVVVLGALKVVSYSLTSGEPAWWFEGTSRQPKGIPVITGGRVYVKAYNRPLSELRLPGFTPDFQKLLAERDKDGDGKLARGEFPLPRIQELWEGIDVSGDDLLDGSEWTLALTDRQGGLFALGLGGSGDVAARLAWLVDDRRTLGGLGSPIVVGETLFLVGEGGLVSSLALADGALVKQDRVGEPDSYYASPVAADGKLYLASFGGLLTVLRAQADWQVLATHALEEAAIWATPALAHGRVYVRSTEALLCFGGE